MLCLQRQEKEELVHGLLGGGGTISCKVAAENLMICIRWLVIGYTPMVSVFSPSVSFIGTRGQWIFSRFHVNYLTQRWSNSHDSHASKFWSDKVFVHMMCCQSFFVGILVIPCFHVPPSRLWRTSRWCNTLLAVETFREIGFIEKFNGQQTHWIATVL